MMSGEPELLSVSAISLWQESDGAEKSSRCDPHRGRPEKDGGKGVGKECPMGAWGVGLFEDDVALDVQGAFDAAVEAGLWTGRGPTPSMVRVSGTASSESV